MARAAVRAKQAQQAQAQAAVKPSRKQRKHASGGNPNQNLFFMRLRRRQKWVFLALAIIFAVSFVALGVGSGNGNSLQQTVSSWFTSWFGNNDPVAKAQGEIKSDPAKGYKDLAAAYVTKQDLPNAIIALKQYLAIKKKDSAQWTALGNYEATQAGTYGADYQQVQQAALYQSPGTIFQPTGTNAGVLGTNSIDEYYQQHNQALSAPFYQAALTGYNNSVTDYRNAAKYAQGTEARTAAEYALATAAQNAGQPKVALHALQRYVALVPNSPLLSQIEAQCKQLGGSCKPTSSK
jgi:tetratricopeptide (TPR) repeat protein